MPKASMYNADGEQLREIELVPQIFDVEVNKRLMHDAVLNYQAKQRIGSASVKTRSEVRGGGRKPWRQKGTGRARHGTNRSPLWVGGGQVFGPRPRDYSYTMPKKARREAIKSALAAKANEGNIKVIDEFKIEAPKTREVINILENFDVSGNILIVVGTDDKMVKISAQNIPGVLAINVDEINIYDVLGSDIMIMTENALARVEEVYGQC